MSIIYDALKKVENSIDKNQGVKDVAHKSKRKVYLLYVSVACLGFIIANTFFNLITKTHQSKINILAKKQSEFSKSEAQGKNLTQAQIKVKNSSLKTQPLKTDTPTFIPLSTEMQKSAAAETKKGKQPRLSFILNGVFFSQDKGYALINNKIVEEGDIVEEATVMRITLDEVELKSQNGLSIKLSNSNK
jgi:type II secretory pathway component PulC